MRYFFHVIGLDGKFLDGAGCELPGFEGGKDVATVLAGDLPADPFETDETESFS
jgi:hypothetical protein